MNINKELNDIIFKWNVDKHYSEYRKGIKALEFIKQFFGTRKAGTKVLLLGNDMISLKMVYEYVTLACDAMMIGLFDEKMITAESVEMYYEYEEVYWVGNTETGKFLAKLRECGVEVIGLYDLLREHGMELEKEFYWFYECLDLDQLRKINENGRQETYIDSMEYIKVKKELSATKDELVATELREKLFFLALHMRDFLTAEELIDGIENPNLKKCWEEILTLLNQIEMTIKKRKQKDIVVYWLDGLSEDLVDDMDYLQAQKGHSYYFNHAYTDVKHTKAVAKMMFWGMKTATDASIIKNETIGMQSSELLRYIQKNGYGFKVYSRYLSQIFEKELIVPSRMLYCPCSQVFWDVIGEMINTDVPTVYLVHELCETHFPWSSVQNCDFSTSKENIINSRHVLNNQLAFYDSMINDNSFRIYMSDHGEGPTRLILHTLMQVYHRSWKGVELEKLYSHLDFAKVIYQIMENGELDVESYDRKQIFIERVDAYAKNSVQDCIINNMYRMGVALGYTGVIDGKILYIKYRNGVEYIHEIDKMPYIPSEIHCVLDDVDIWTDSNISDDYIDELRKVCKKYPDELMRHSKFKYSALAYEVCNNIMHYRRNAKEIINALFAQYNQGSIALRGGGEHSVVLYGWLTEDNRKKIDVIIDASKECVSSYLKLPVIQPGEKLPEDIQYILISSKEMGEIFTKETMRLYPECNIIDIYQVLENHGLLCKKAFYHGDVTCYDVEWPEE